MKKDAVIQIGRIEGVTVFCQSSESFKLKEDIIMPYLPFSPELIIVLVVVILDHSHLLISRIKDRSAGTGLCDRTSWNLQLNMGDRYPFLVPFLDRIAKRVSLKEFVVDFRAAACNHQG